MAAERRKEQISEARYPHRAHAEIIHAHNLLAFLVRTLGNDGEYRDERKPLLAALAVLSWSIHDERGDGPFRKMLERIEGMPGAPRSAAR
jgi:hypothetical protein